MKKTILFVCALLMLSSCNLKERFDSLNDLESELQKEFKHPNISISFNISTGEESNFYQATFYEYEIANKTNSELKSKALLVNSFILPKINQNAIFDYIEVRFTESNSEEAVSFTNFIFQPTL